MIEGHQQYPLFCLGSTGGRKRAQDGMVGQWWDGRVFPCARCLLLRIVIDGP